MFMVTQQAASTAQSAGEIARSTAHHSMASGPPGAFDLVLLALGVVVVIVTTTYSLLYLIRPGETADDHIKRRVLEDGTGGSR